MRLHKDKQRFRENSENRSAHEPGGLFHSGRGCAPLGSPGGPPGCPGGPRGGP